MRRSFESLLAEARPKLRSFCRRWERSREDAEDMEMEAVAKAFRFFDSYEHRQSFSNWILAIAHNVGLDRARLKHRRIVYATPAHSPDVSDTVLEDTASTVDRYFVEEIGCELLAALDTVPSAARRIILLEADGVGDAEASRMLGIPVGTVRSIKHRARHKLRSKIVLN